MNYKLQSLTPFCFLMQHALVFPVHSSYWIINASGTGRFVGNAFFLQGLLVRTIGCNLVLWTLAIEAWFYLATPWFATLSNRLLIALIIVSLILFCFLPAPALSPFWGVSAVLYLWPWLLGFMIARKEIPFVALALGLMGLGAVHRFILEPRAGLTYGLVLGAVLGANRVRLPPWLAQITTYLGDLSYPLYLFHLPLIILLYAGFKLSSPAEMAAIILVAVMVIEAGVDRGLKERLWRPVFTAVFHASRAASLRRFSRP